MAEPPSRRASGRTNDDEARLWGQLLWRGVRKRCPRCGSKGLYRSWFQMRERCPGCGMLFEREPGFFVGAYTINLIISIVALFVLVMVLVAVMASDPEADYVVFLVLGAIIAIVVPVAGYPYARTVWSAIDLGMTPLEPVEEAEAALALAGAEFDRRRIDPIDPAASDAEADPGDIEPAARDEAPASDGGTDRDDPDQTDAEPDGAPPR